MKKIAILGYDTYNIGDDIQSFVCSTLVKPDYMVIRDDYEKIYNFDNGEIIKNLDEEVVLIMNGWFMQRQHPKGVYSFNQIKFPIKNSKIRPFYISTCLAKPAKELLEKDKLEDYKKNQPFFSRDRNTSNILNKLGVKSEFFGCLTQTLSIEKVGENKEYQDKYSDKIFYVDCAGPRDKSSLHLSHLDRSLISTNPIERLKLARKRMQMYRYAKKIVTSRLHCFLPCRAMGLNVEYVGAVDWRTQDLVTKNPDVEKMKKIFYENLEKIKN